MADPEPDRRLGRRSWPTLAAERRLGLLVPVGSCEQHGPHLPLDTDTRIAVALAEAAATARPGWIVAPAVAIGASGEHQGFPGTLSIGTDVLAAVLVEIGRSALPPDGGGPFASVVFVNGHGGNHAAIGAAIARLTAESRAVDGWSPAFEGGDAHAGHTETSLLLHLAPGFVGDARPVGDTRALAALADDLRAGGVAAVSASGVLGDASGASADAGADLFSAAVGHLVDWLDHRSPLVE